MLFRCFPQTRSRRDFVRRLCPNILPGIVACFLLLGTVAGAQEKDVVELRARVFKVELVLSESLEPRRQVLESILEGAQERLLIFAERYHWEYLMEEPLMRRAFIFDSKKGYDDFLRELYPEEKDAVIPKSFTAGFKDDVFFAVSPEIYREVAPQFFEPDFYEKLVCHELAHRLHTRIVNGNEEMMGPLWFWEGLATLMASQFENKTKKIDQKTIRSLLKSARRGDYRDYNALMKRFVKLVPLPELIRRSYREDFATWLLENANPKVSPSKTESADTSQN